MSLPWRKRLDYRLLRWQARFESSGFNRTAPWILAAATWLALVFIALARSRELSLEANMAEAMQSVWLIGEGFKPDSSLLSHSYLFDQAGFLIYPVALVAKIFPTAITLLVIQSGALALGIVPLWGIARRVANLRIGSTLAIVVAYAAFSAIHTLNIAGFHLEALAVPALMGLVHNGFRERWVRYWLLIAVVLSARADLGIAVAGLGVVWMFEGKARLGRATLGAGFVWAAVAILVVQPRFANGDFPHVDAFASYGGDDPFSILWGIVASPIQFTKDLFAQANFVSVVTLFAPVLFLPVVAPRFLFPALPLYALYLVADVPEGRIEEAGQVVPMTAFIFVATVFALARTGRVLVEKVNVDKRVVGALVFTAAVFFVRDSFTSPYQEPWSWGRRETVDVAREDAVALVPEDAVVRAAPKVLPLLTERPGLFLLDTTRPFAFIESVDQATARVNWIIFDPLEAPLWDNPESFCTDLALVQWAEVFRDAGIRVYAHPAEIERLDLPVVGLSPGDDRPVCADS